mmetsp:Transcript_60729/g.144622  ORF Transcript_60729/g.144622 Transcript_60729/m.144622 type:complete len:302 (-) Transcript_60729:7929-8834(-)
MLQQCIFTVRPCSSVLLDLPLNVLRSSGASLLIIVRRLQGARRAMCLRVQPIWVLILKHRLEVVPEALPATSLQRRSCPRNAPLRVGTAMQQERLPPFLLLPTIERRVQMPSAFMWPPRPMILVLEVAFRPTARTSSWTTRNALPALRLLAQQFRIHAALNVHFRLPHVRPVALQLHTCKLHELRQVIQRPVGICLERRQSSHKNCRKRLIGELLATVLEHEGKLVHGEVGNACQRPICPGRLHSVLHYAETIAEVALELSAVLIHKTLFEAFPLLVELHEEVLRGVNGIHHHMPPVALGE